MTYQQALDKWRALEAYGHSGEYEVCWCPPLIATSNFSRPIPKGPYMVLAKNRYERPF